MRVAVKGAIEVKLGASRFTERLGILPSHLLFHRLPLDGYHCGLSCAATGFERDFRSAGCTATGHAWLQDRFLCGASVSRLLGGRACASAAESRDALFKPHRCHPGERPRRERLLLSLPWPGFSADVR